MVWKLLHTTFFNTNFVQQDEEAAAMVYEEFVASFEDSQKLAKAWVKGGVVNPGEKSSKI